MTWESPLFLLLALLAWPVGFWSRPGFRSPGIEFSSTGQFRGSLPVRGWRLRLAPLSACLRAAAVFLAAVALAGPRGHEPVVPAGAAGQDLVIALDVSQSMRAIPDGQEGAPSPLDAISSTLFELVVRRRGDRVGLVVFAGEALSLVPPTGDHDLVRGFLERFLDETTLESGTALGDGLASACALLEPSAGSGVGVVVLVSDGRSNRGRLDPERAARLAADRGVRVLAIGVGGEAHERERMEELARTTGGRFVGSAGRRDENVAVSRALDDLLGPSVFLPAGTTSPLDLARRALIGALLAALAALFLETVPLRVFP